MFLLISNQHYSKTWMESYSTVDENLPDSTLASLTFFHINKSKVLIFLIFLIETDLRILTLKSVGELTVRKGGVIF